MQGEFEAMATDTSIYAALFWEPTHRLLGTPPATAPAIEVESNGSNFVDTVAAAVSLSVTKSLPAAVFHLRFCGPLRHNFADYKICSLEEQFALWTGETLKWETLT